jgi:ribosome-binding protein aMBF1 (putative translation factor)
MATITKSQEELRNKVIESAPFFHAYLECAPEIQAMIAEMMEIICDPETDEGEKEVAVDAIVEATQPGLTTDVIAKYKEGMEAAREIDTTVRDEEKEFADNVRSLMEERQWNQETLAAKIGVTQPAVSNMLKRQCRPQNRTILKLAEVFGVAPDAIWPGFESRS